MVDTLMLERFSENGDLSYLYFFRVLEDYYNSANRIGFCCCVAGACLLELRQLIVIEDTQCS